MLAEYKIIWLPWDDVNLFINPVLIYIVFFNTSA